MLAPQATSAVEGHERQDRQPFVPLYALAQLLCRLAKIFSFPGSCTSSKTIIPEGATPMQCLPSDVAICYEFGRESRAHGTVFPLHKAHIRAVEAMQLPRASDSVHEQAERDADRIEHGSLAATIFGHEHGELLMQCNGALRKAPKVIQLQTIHTQSRRSGHLFS